MTRPEQFPKPFKVYRQASETSDRGRIKPGKAEEQTEVKCILSTARPEEQQRYAQIGVTVTHTIIQRGAPVAKEQDIFALLKGGIATRRFRVQAVHDKGEMGINTVYYCEERSDLK